MGSRSRGRRGLGVVATVLLLAAACSGGDNGQAQPTPEDEAARRDQERAVQLLVRLSDLPPGWTASPHRATTEDDRVERELRDCLEVGPRPARTADASSDDFRLGQAQVTSRVTTTKTAEDATRQFDAATGARFRPCLVQVYKRSFGRAVGQELANEDVKAEPLPVERLADGAVGNRLTISVPSPGGREVYVADAYFVLSGRSQVSVNFLNVGAPVDGEVERAVLARVADRARG